LPYEGNDNKGSTDYGLTTSPDGSGAATTITPDIGDDGTLTFYLKVPARYSGDNFQVEVSKCNYAGTVLPERVASMSSVYTSWKRVFVEKDRMFRKGGLLAGDVAQGANTIYIAKTYDAANSRWVRVDNVLLNDRIAIFDTQSTFESPHDEACVIGLANENDDQVARVTALLGTMDCQGGYTLARGYMASVSAAGVWDFSSGRSAGVGVVANPSGVPYDTASNQINGVNSAFYDADMRDIEQPFDDGYMEFVGQRSGAGAMPFLPQAWFDAPGANGLPYFSQIWFNNFQPAADTPPHADVPHNYMHLIGVSSALGYAGLSNSTFDWSYIFQQGIEGTNWNPDEKRNYTRATTDHELGHQFDPNFCSDLPTCKTPPQPPTWGAHDYRHWWGATTTDCPNSNPCLMDPDAGTPTDTVNRLCKEDLFLGDPNNNYPCQTTGGTMDRIDTAVRTCTDPR
jgi:hypothetical protein